MLTKSSGSKIDTSAISSLSGVPTDGVRCLMTSAAIAVPIVVKMNAPSVMRMSRPIMGILLQSRRASRLSCLAHERAERSHRGRRRSTTAPSGRRRGPGGRPRSDRATRIPDRFTEIVRRFRGSTGGRGRRVQHILRPVWMCSPRRSPRPSSGPSAPGIRRHPSAGVRSRGHPDRPGRRPPGGGDGRAPDRRPVRPGGSRVPRGPRAGSARSRRRGRGLVTAATSHLGRRVAGDRPVIDIGPLLESAPPAAWSEPRPSTPTHRRRCSTPPARRARRRASSTPIGTSCTTSAATPRASASDPAIGSRSSTRRRSVGSSRRCSPAS